MDLDTALNTGQALAPVAPAPEPEPVGLEILHAKLLSGVKAIVSKAQSVLAELTNDGSVPLVITEQSQPRITELLARLREARKQVEKACKDDLEALKAEMKVYTQQRDDIFAGILAIDETFSKALIAATKTVEHGSASTVASKTMGGSLGSTVTVTERVSGKLAENAIEVKHNKHGEVCLRIRVPERYLKEDWLTKRMLDLFAWTTINSALAADKTLEIPGIERVVTEGTSARAREIVQ